MMALAAAVAVVAAPKAPSTAPSSIQVWTLIVASLAVLATVISAILLRLTGKGSVDAAKRSAEAVSRSAQAAHDAVAVNADSAAGIARRAEADALAKRYQEAATLLGDAKAPVRLAGVYAMARLADDWPEQRQTCVDVLCAYLRFTARENSADEDVLLQQTICQLIAAHLVPGDDAEDWSGLNFNLRGTYLRDLSIRDARIGGLFDLGKATLAGSSQFSDLVITGALSLEAATIFGVCEFSRLKIVRLPGRSELPSAHWSGVQVLLDELRILPAPGIASGFLFDVEELPGTGRISAMELVISAETHFTVADGFGHWHPPLWIGRGRVDDGVRFGVWINPQGEQWTSNEPVVSLAGLEVGANTTIDLSARKREFVDWTPARVDPTADIRWTLDHEHGTAEHGTAETDG